MPRAEIGSTKYLNNKLKSVSTSQNYSLLHDTNGYQQKGLQRLRWYCQACERQMRDENGFKWWDIVIIANRASLTGSSHVQSEPHVRQMLLIGEDPKKHIRDFSNQFQHDFLQLLRTSHGEKQVHCNNFYQQYIAEKEHLHMNATKWPSLTEFAKHLGREGICRVEDTEKGLFIAWIDNSPEALRRQDILRKKELQDRNDEEREQQQLRAQIERARDQAASDEDADAESKVLQRTDGEKIKLNFGLKLIAKSSSTSQQDWTANLSAKIKDSTADARLNVQTPKAAAKEVQPGSTVSTQNKNPFKDTKSWVKPPPRKMTEQERIMKEEMAAMGRKAARKHSGLETGSSKRLKVS